MFILPPEEFPVNNPQIYLGEWHKANKQNSGGVSQKHMKQNCMGQLLQS